MNITDLVTRTCRTNLAGSCSIREASGSYRDDSYVFIEISKTCGTSVSESPSYSVKGHL